MKLNPALPLLLAVLPWAFAFSLQRTEDSSLRRRNDRETLDSYARQGLCFSYTGAGSFEKSIEPCKTWCEKEKGESGTHGCSNFIPEGTNESIIPKFRDDDGNQYMVGTCFCDAPLADIIVEVVAAGLAKLDNILCAVMVTAFKEVAEIGLMFVPGGAVVKGAEGAAKAIRYAKSAYENGMNAGDFFDGWVGDACGVKNWDFSLDSMFTDMVDAPDSLMGEGVSSTGCALKNKSKCRKRDKKPDPKTSSQVHRGSKTAEKPAQKDTSTAKPKEKTSTDKTKGKTSTKTSKSTAGTATTTKPPACKIKRAPYTPEKKKLVGKFGEVEKRTTEECDKNGNKVTVHHWTSTDPAIGHYIQDRKDMAKVTCKKAHTQACYHYRYKNEKDMTEWTCQQTTTMHDREWGWDGTATDAWGSTAIARQKGQHWWPWANGFVLREQALDANGKPRKNAKGNDIIRHCQRDEFPPRYFWPEKGKVPKHMRQLVRLVPDDENGGAGGLWAGFCNDNNAASTIKAANAATYDTYVVSENLKSKQKAPPRTEAPAGKDKTIHSSVEVSTLRAIFSIADFEGLKPLPEDGLRENPCYPSDLVDDPGWALLTDDPWYKDAANVKYQQNTALYQKAPDVKKVGDVVAKGPPKYLFESMADIQAVKKQLGLKDEKRMWKKWVGDGVGQIPQDLWGLLPGLPAFPKPKRRRWSVAELKAANGTSLGLVDGDDGDGVDWDGSEDDVDAYSDEELERWLADHRELVARLYDDGAEQTPPWWPSPTAPPEVEAESTPVGQGESTPTPALAGSKVTDGMPGPTS